MSEVLNAYKVEHGTRPKSPQELVKFCKQREDLKNLSLEEARKALGIRRRGSSFSGIGSLTKKANPKWTVGKQVLLSKDRIGIIRYVGPVPEQGKGHDVIWYGVELIDGTVGYNDGTCKGTRYFDTLEGKKRGMFVPPDKIRRVINEKDKQRRDSYVQIANEVRQLKGQHAMDVIEANGALVIHCNNIKEEDETSDKSKATISSKGSSSHDNNTSNFTNNSNNSNNSNNNRSIYIEPPRIKHFDMDDHDFDHTHSHSHSHSHSRDDSNNISPLSTDDHLRPWEKEEFAHGGPSHAANMKAKARAKAQSQAQAHTQAQAQAQAQAQMRPKSKSKSKMKSKTKTQSDNMLNDAGMQGMQGMQGMNTHVMSGMHGMHGMHGIYGRPKAYSIESDNKEYGSDLQAVDTYETILEYIVRQSEESRQILLDVYADPKLHSILLDAFNQLKTMNEENQMILWPQLIKRWRRTLRLKKF